MFVPKELFDSFDVSDFFFYPISCLKKKRSFNDTAYMRHENHAEYQLEGQAASGVA